MSHTNSTTNYGLPQFVTTDKPFWLTDINTAFSDIDTAINTAKTTADTANGNAVQAMSDASAAATTASGADSKASGAVASISDQFDSTSTYIVGDIVIYNSLLYRCTAAVTTPGPWTGTDNWTRTTVEDITNAINANISTLSTDLTNQGLNLLYTRQITITGLNITVPAGTIRDLFWNFDITSYIPTDAKVRAIIVEDTDAGACVARQFVNSTSTISVRVGNPTSGGIIVDKVIIKVLFNFHN